MCVCVCVCVCKSIHEHNRAKYIQGAYIGLTRYFALNIIFAFC